MKTWTEAQLAIISCGMVDVQEVFLPYQLTAGGETNYQLYLHSDRMLTDRSTQ